ncbi:serine protease filzig-like isoform X2 [Ornithodoros turicata]|uniref:serine protease filzig-like isoform X2 n=1 Tax=Ornithodoros turicata TaxID=34597 RepID=UPI00313921F0
MGIRWTSLIAIATWTCRLSVCTWPPTSNYYTPPSTASWRRWTISKSRCEGVQGETGICMFNWDCIRKDGIVLSTCMDGFLLGACCKLPEEDTLTSPSSWSEATYDNTQRPVAHIENTTAYEATPTEESDEHQPTTTRRPTLPPATSTTDAPGHLTVPSSQSSMWPFLRLPTSAHATNTGLTTEKIQPGSQLPMAPTYMTSWATTRPGILFTPTRYFMRPTVVPSTQTGPLIPTTYVRRPPLQNLFASTPLGVLGTMLSRPFLRPTTPSAAQASATGKQPWPEKDVLMTQMQSDAPRVTTNLPDIHEPTVSTALSSIVSQLSSHSVSRLPSLTLNTIEDLTYGAKPSQVRLTTAGGFTDGSTDWSSPPEFVDLTEVRTTQKPSTRPMEYTLDFDQENQQTVTHSIVAESTGRPPFGEVNDVSVTHLDSKIEKEPTKGTPLLSSGMKPINVFHTTTTTTKTIDMHNALTTKAVDESSSDTATTRKPSTTTPMPTEVLTTTKKPKLTTHETRPLTYTYPARITFRPSTLFKFPLMTTSPSGWPTMTLHNSHHPPSLTSSLAYRPTTPIILGLTTAKPTKAASTTTSTSFTGTSSSKLKASSKPAKPTISGLSHAVKPTKAVMTSKSPTKKSTSKPIVTKVTTSDLQSPKLSSTQPSSTSSVNTTTAPNTPRWDYRKHCGVRPLRPQGRIVGGRNSFFGEWPWQVLVKEATWLGLFIKNKCGGVLINRKYALTAAHCQPGFLSSLLVVLGEHDLSGDYESLKPVSIPVKRMVVHRNYNPATFENDLALLELERPVEFKPHIVPICLPERNEDFTGRTSYVTGWGKLSHGGSVPNVLQYVQVPILSNNKCQKMFKIAGHVKSIRENFVCAGYDHGNRDSCEGDSGGPLTLLRDDGRWVLVGTVSHGIRCAEPNMPGVYMRTSAYRPWIDSVINPK